jgi:N-acetyl-gamma-glutamyl-phosphate reductase
MATPDPSAPTTPVRVGIVGVSGYAGVELLRIVHGHPGLELAWVAAGKWAGKQLDEAWPGWAGLGARTIEAFSPEEIALDGPMGCDAVFLALPHGHAGAIVPGILAKGVRVVDLGADHRLRDAEVYAEHYGAPHPHPEQLATAVYGLAEWNREALAGAMLIATPGCYPTAVALAALPLVGLVESGLADAWVVADCISGVSGAGRKAGPRNLFCETTDRAQAYGLGGTHRHAPEMEQTLGIPVSFTPHLAPMNRGMVATVHLKLRGALELAELRARFEDAYGDEPMIQLCDAPPSTADVRGTNRAHLAVAVDARRGVATVCCVIDNLVKGAAGQAVQCLNIALGLPETQGLPVVPLLP